MLTVTSARCWCEMIVGFVRVDVVATKSRTENASRDGHQIGTPKTLCRRHWFRSSGNRRGFSEACGATDLAAKPLIYKDKISGWSDADSNRRYGNQSAPAKPRKCRTNFAPQPESRTAESDSALYSHMRDRLSAAMACLSPTRPIAFLFG